MINLQDDEMPDFEVDICHECYDEDGEEEYKGYFYCKECLDKILSEGV